MTVSRIAVMGFSAALVVTACSTDDAPSGDLQLPGGGDPIANDPGQQDPLGNVNSADRRLRRMGSEQAFYDALRAALIAQRGDDSYGYPEADPEVVEVDVSASPGEQSPTSTVVESPSDTSNSDSAAAAPESGVTTTNVQEFGVDEADRVKSDGEYLYIVSRAYTDYYGSEPVQPAGSEVPAVPPIDQPTETDSAPNPDVQPIVDPPAAPLQPDTPDAQPVYDMTLDFEGLYHQGMYLHDTGDAKSLVLNATGYDYTDYDDNYDYSVYYNPKSRSLLTNFDVSNPLTAQQSTQLDLDGYTISSRRIGDQIFLASTYQPSIPDVDPFSVDAATWENIVNSTDLSTILPKYTVTGSGSESTLINPADCFVANQPENEVFANPQIVSLVTVNLPSMAVADSECFLGDTNALYATAESVYLSTSQWSYVEHDSPPEAVPDVDGGGAGAVVEPFYDSRIDTDIHRFAISDGGLHYRGSGTVAGHLGWNSLQAPFRMSEHNGVLRVVTHNAEQSADVSPVNVTILESNSDGDLVRIAQLPNDENPEHIGKPFEELYATRFLGDTAYLVTFRQTDPLYVIDLADPRTPTVAGELLIDGYSDYLHPIADGYLLGIGKDAVAPAGSSDTGQDGITQGVKLSLFDVRDSSNPIELQSVVVGQRGTDAGALFDHRGITVQQATDTQPTRVAFGIDVAGDPEAPAPTPENAWDWYPQNYTGLHGFEIKTGADAGIVRKGVIKIDPNTTTESPWEGSWEDRSVLVNDATYYIHGAEVYAAPWGDLSNSVGPR